MTELFLKLLNMSIAASWLVLAVIAVRLCLKKAPKWITCLLWGIVALRLVIPVFVHSSISLLPSAEVIPQDIVTSQTPAIYSGISVVNSTVNPLITEHFVFGGNAIESILSVASMVWIAGMGIMLLYAAISYGMLHRKVRISVSKGKNIQICDQVESPFVMGVFQPKIYIPSGMEEQQLQYVLAHENAHIQRRDHWWKPFSFLLLAVYWFNPLLWLAYILLCRDIEQACDEKVVSCMDTSQKKCYAQTLIACSSHRRMIMACPVAFGEIGIRARIKGIGNYKKPTFWILLMAVLLCLTTAICFLTSPEQCQHTYHSEITTQSTCTQNGVETRTCQKCEHMYTVPAVLLEHTYDQGIVVLEPNCVKQGCKELTCTGCGIKKTEKIEKTGHIAGEPFVSKEPNCTEKGELSTVCTFCHEIYVVEILATNDMHDLTETVLQEPTCTSSGEGIKTCSRCDYSEMVTYAQMEHHIVMTLVVPATCFQSGYDAKSCTTCDYSVLVENPNRAECVWVTAAGGSPTYCQYCGRVKSRTDSTLLNNWQMGFSPPETKTPGNILPSIQIWP